MESKRRSERTKAGLERARAEGQQIGGPKKTDEEQRQQIQKMVKEKDMSYREVAEEVGLSKSTVHKIVNKSDTDSTV